MDKILPDFSRMTLRERMDWLTDASEDAKKFLASFANSHDKELSALCKAMRKWAKQGKVDDSILVNVKIKAMPNGIVRDTSHVKLRSSSDKVARFMRRNGDNFSDYHDADYSESPRDPAWKANAPKVATSRPDSPFKRAGRSAAKVVIVRKGKPE